MTSLGVIGELDEQKFEWKIANFFSLSAGKGEYFTSPSFVFADNSFHLRIYPSGETAAKSGFISVFLENESGDTFYLKMTVYVKKSDGSTFANETADVCIQTAIGFPYFCEKSILQQHESELVKSNILTVVCILKLKESEKQNTVKTETKENIQGKQAHKTMDQKGLTELDVLSENLKDFSANKESCDTVLQVKDIEFKAHKFILMARSSVFAAMFQHDTLEKQTGVVKIPDCDPESFQEFLDYLYCGKLEDISYHSAFQVYITSNKYDVQKLKEYCVEYLMESLTADNVCEIVKLADKHEEEKLVSAAQYFFIENWNQIFITSEWENFMKTDHRLAHQLLVKLSKSKESQ